jgi:Barrel-sandwich domain of CusB or HlyD membrane-fusion
MGQKALPMNARPMRGIQRWLDQHCESSAQVSGGVVVLATANAGQPQTIAEWPASGQLTTPLAAAAHAALQRARPVVLAPALGSTEARHNRVISLPLRCGDRLLGAVALAVQANETHLVETLVKELTRASAHLGESMLPAPAAAHATDTADQRSASIGGQALQLQALLLSQNTLAEGALAMLTQLAALLGCDRVALAVVQRGELEWLALSGSAEVKSEPSLMRLMLSAMQESLDQAACIHYPAVAADPVHIVLAHAELHQRTGHALTALPLVTAASNVLTDQRGVRVGALLIEQKSRLDDGQIALCDHLARLIAPLVDLRARNERGGLRRTVDTLRRGVARITRRNDPWPKLVATAGLTLALIAAFLPIGYRIGAPVRIEGLVQRVVAAPIDGFLGKSHVRPGDTVHAGDLLIELSDTDLMLESRRWESALAQHENSVSASLARSDRAQFVVSQGKAGEARAQLELVRQQLARTRLLAPMDGIVIKGDLSQTLGAPVQRGDALLTLAPAQQFRLIIEVDERDVAEVKAGQTGQLALSALPVDTLAFTVQRVTPVATVRDGRNAFEVEAKLAGPAPALRTGLEGVAKIDAGERSFAWIWGHRAVDWLRLAWWSV